MTMLSTNPARRIPAKDVGGLNRREEHELTQFEKPVLDIERMGRRRVKEYSINRLGGDISEEMQFMNSNSRTKL